MGQFQFKLSDIGEGTAEAEIAAWHVKVGDRVKEDQLLVEMMTDKATVELTSPVDGIVESLNGNAGDKIKVGAVLVSLKTEAEGAAAPQPPAASTVTMDSAAANPAEESVESSGQPAGPNSRDPRPAASPAVRRRAEELGIRLQQVHPSGPQGRITHADLDTYIRGAGGGDGMARRAQRTGISDVRVIGLRRQIAEKMQASNRSVPHFTYVEEVDVTAVEELRAYLNSQSGKPKLTVLPFVMQALVKAIPDFPQMNALFDDEAGVIHCHEGVHIGIATQTDRGLMAPVVRHAEALDIYEMAVAVARLAAAARDGKATREELTGSTITITSLGLLAGIAHTPIINRPEIAIIGPNKIADRPVVRAGVVVVRKVMNISSSFDHRVVDGADGAAFIQRVRGLLEQPATLFM